MGQARAVTTVSLQMVEDRAVTVTKWREGERTWVAVEIDGSCAKAWDSWRLHHVVFASAYADGVVAGLRAAAEP